MEISAHGKLNLTLDVLRRREDGYHDLRMIMQSVELCDTITLQPTAESGIQVTTNLSFLPADGRNLAAIAAERFRAATGKGQEGLAIQIYKRIPVCAGMGGGSSDAASVLRALNELTGTGLSPEELARLGQSVGSDVPYCVLRGTALAEGRGEVLTPLPPLPDCRIVLCKPRFSISTPELFSRICCGKIRCRPDTAGVIAALEAGDLTGVARRLYNVFEDVLPVRLAGEITAIKQTMQGCGALGAAMSGTGPTVFGLFARERGAEQAAELLRRTYSEVFLTRPYNLV